MNEEIGSRLASLVKQGEEFTDGLRPQQDDDWVDDSEMAIYQAWLTATGNLFLAIGGPTFEYFSRLREVVTSQTNPAGLQVYVVRRVFDLLVSLFEEWSKGSVRLVEDIVAATLFDGFLDDAERFRSAGRKIESTTLAATVLEHALKTVAARRKILVADRALEPIVAELVEAGVLARDDGKRLEQLARVHDRALASDWDAIQPGQVEELILGTRVLVRAMT